MGKKREQNPPAGYVKAGDIGSFLRGGIEVNAIVPEGFNNKNIDGGSAASIYLPVQVIDGGGA